MVGQVVGLLLTRGDEGVDGHPVVLVLLVGVGAPEAEPREEGPEEVGDQPDDDKGSNKTQVSCNTWLV